MAFRRRRDAWDEFLSKVGPELRACGLPDRILADRMRFLVFLEHGYDDWGRSEFPHSYFDAAVLSDDQVARLAELLEGGIGAEYAPTVRAWLQPGNR